MGGKSIARDEAWQGHFTYTLPDGDLQQGDIISRASLSRDTAAELSCVPEDFRILVVLTQSCDLVRPRSKAEFIALAPAIPLSDIVEARIAEYQKSEVSKRGNVCGSNHKSKIHEFLLKLLNNNDPQYFYLHEEHSFGLLEPMCVLLRCSKSVSTEMCYSSCCESRILTLNEEFRAKLGWLVGSIYSRVATKDWPKTEAKKRIEAHLADVCRWEDPKRLEMAEQVLKDGRPLPESESELFDFIAGLEIRTRQEVILDRIRTLFTDIYAPDKNKDELSGELCDALKADATFRQHTAK